MFTERGLAQVAAALAEMLGRGQIVVSDGSQQDGISIEDVSIDGSRVVVKGSFGEDKANFDWKERWVVVDQEVIDRDDVDRGRKAQGTVWPVEITFDLGA